MAFQARLGGTNAIGVGVSYSGEVQGPVPGLIPPNCPSWEPATTFSGGTVFNPPPSDYGCIPLSGGNPGVNTITFSQPVVDPVMAIWSLGQPGLTASFVFQTIQPISIESGGPSSEYSFGKSITQMNNSIYGAEGNSTIQFHGTFTQISWTNPTNEYYYTFTVGVPALQDTLQITPATGFDATGCVGGPFTVTNETFSLTNSGTNSLTWSLANTSSWLDASPGGGTLAVGGSTNVIVSLSSNANSLTSGIILHLYGLPI